MKYYDDPEIKETADFVRKLMPPGRRRLWARFDWSILAYVVLIAIMLSFLFIDFGARKESFEIKRSINSSPEIAVDVSAGNLGGGLMDPERFWNESLNSSCAGIEDFYSNIGFERDWKALLEDYQGIYSACEGEKGFRVPGELRSDADCFDCEDIAHSSRCLAELYGVECSFWLRQNVGEIVPNEGEHLGICCEVSGDWRCI